MNKKEVTEIKRRFKKETSSFSRLCGCYVAANKEMVLTFNEMFLGLEDEEQYKYIEIAKKAMSGTVGNNLLTLEFDEDAATEGNGQYLLQQIVESGMKDEKLLMTLYQRIIDTYDYAGNYFIVLFKDAYDVPMKTSDGLMLDDSEEVYDYMICAICPVELSKAGLGYRPLENRITNRERDWVVGAVDTAFTYPLFDDRRSDIHGALVYTKTPKAPRNAFYAQCLNLTERLTAAQKKVEFSNILERALGDDETAEDAVLEIMGNISDFVVNETKINGEDTPVPLTPEDLTDILSDSGISETKTNRIVTGYQDAFEEDVPDASEVLDAKSLEANELRIEKNALKDRVVELSREVKSLGGVTEEGEHASVVIKVPQSLADGVETTIIDGKRCIMVPLLGDEVIAVNGVRI